MKKLLQRRVILVSLSVVLLLSLIGCANNKPTSGQSGTSQANNAQPYKIGAILSLTGATAQMGGPQRDAMQYNVDKVNKAGGINGHPIQLIVEDDEGSPDKAQTLAKKLIDKDQVSAILGSSSSIVIQAEVVVAEEKKVPVLMMSPTERLSDGKKYIFRVPAGTILEAQASCKLVVNDLKAQTVGIINDTTEYGTSIAAAFEKAVAQYPGLKIVAKESYDPTSIDMTPQVLRIESKKPDVIYIGGSGVAPAQVIKNLKQTGYTGKIVGASGVGTESTVKNAGDAAEGVYLVGRLNYGNPGSSEKELFDFVKQKTGGLPSIFHVSGWDSVLLIVNAMKTAGNDREKIRDALENTKGLQGIDTFNMTPTDHNGLTIEAMKMFRIKNSLWVPWNS